MRKRIGKGPICFYYNNCFLSHFFHQKTLHSAWKEISKLRDNVSSKRCKLQLQKQKLKLFAILRGEVCDMSYIAYLIAFTVLYACI